MNAWIPSLAASTLLLSFTVQADNGLPIGGGHLYPAQSLSGSFGASQSHFGLAAPMPSWPQSQPIGGSAGAGNPPANQEERPAPDDDPEPLTDEPEEED